VNGTPYVNSRGVAILALPGWIADRLTVVPV
jgi:hypothetical protein